MQSCLCSRAPGSPSSSAPWLAAAESRVEDITAEFHSLAAELEAEVARVSAEHDPANLKLESETLKPTRSDVKVEDCALLWLPQAV